MNLEPLATVKITYLGGFEADYQSNCPIELGFDAKLGYVSVYMDGHEYSHEWEMVKCVSSDGQVTLLDVYEEGQPDA